MLVGRGRLGELRLLQYVRLVLPVRLTVLDGLAWVGVRLVRASNGAGNGFSVGAGTGGVSVAGRSARSSSWRAGAGAGG
ncbi:hypothetical protein, partial [Streptomyces albidoflavus]|uniref:hypothetical protein n=1 Tax=Streptomyces albidoflavus TaxID=1886 RepID=UPI00055CBE9B